MKHSEHIVNMVAASFHASWLLLIVVVVLIFGWFGGWQQSNPADKPKNSK
ncbi:MAG: hypothetical protein ABSB42_06195 [Tepidisphaeraceae bacterium]|jgi:hypothetical protein